jgi:hypothetical protein
MTMPEWWAAIDAHARANGVGERADGPTKMMSAEKARQFAAELRAERRADMQRAMGVNSGRG